MSPATFRCPRAAQHSYCASFVRQCSGTSLFFLFGPSLPSAAAAMPSDDHRALNFYAFSPQCGCPLYASCCSGRGFAHRFLQTRLTAAALALLLTLPIIRIRKGLLPPRGCALPGAYIKRVRLPHGNRTLHSQSKLIPPRGQMSSPSGCFSIYSSQTAPGRQTFQILLILPFRLRPLLLAFISGATLYLALCISCGAACEICAQAALSGILRKPS